jgi:ubiquinone/menaquinone biosynthesis C-methylase UbiE
MAKRVCPWWLGYFLASPLRRWLENPKEILATYVREGMTVLEPGPGMGFFTTELARRVGANGRVVAIDLQPKMLHGLKRRLQKSGLENRIDARLASADSLGLDDLRGKVDFILAYAVVHEMPSSRAFFSQAAIATKPGARLLLVEPRGHVTPEEFEGELEDAAQAGFSLTGRPDLPRGRAALLERTDI